MDTDMQLAVANLVINIQVF